MSAVELPRDERLTYRFLAAVDIEGFSKLDVLEQRQAQVALDQVLKTAAAGAGLDRKRWTLQVSGDGELAVLPPDTNGLRLVADYPQSSPRPSSRSTAPGRLSQATSPPRAASRDHRPWAVRSGRPGADRDIASARLRALRRRLADHQNVDLAVVVSASLYHDVIQTRFRGLEPRDFALVDFDAKGTSYVGYIYEGSLPERRRGKLYPWR